MYFVPLAILLQMGDPAMSATTSITWSGFLQNTVPVVGGNIIGGSVLVGLVGHIIYRRSADAGVP